jgi:hypothetical protein
MPSRAWHPDAMSDLDKYLIQLRRELTRSQARLSRAERQRDRLLEENAGLRQRLTLRTTPHRRKPRARKPIAKKS